MKYLISLPETAVSVFNKVSGKPEESWFCTSDPADKKVGSGGGTSHLLTECWKRENNGKPFDDWLKEEKRVLIHGGGQSRRLPAYAPEGKLLIPVPVFRWARGQRFDQALLDLQIPLLEKIINASPDTTHTLLASGDALVMSDAGISGLPEADVISFGLGVDPALASRHGVFICPRNNPSVLQYMLQKPSASELGDLASDYYFYIDVGIWLLSDKAVKILMRKCGWNDDSASYENGNPENYDFYGTFGLSLGKTPVKRDSDIEVLTTAVVQIPDGEFYHFGTTREIISSSLALQNKVTDQRSILNRNIKPHPSIFIQNSIVEIEMEERHAGLWIENSHVPATWVLNGRQVITGVPENSWNINIPAGVCLDVVPLKDGKSVIRIYGFSDPFRGPSGGNGTVYLGQPFVKWLSERGLSLSDLGVSASDDIHDVPVFPVVDKNGNAEELIKWIIKGTGSGKDAFLHSGLLSASKISKYADILSLENQRRAFRAVNWRQIADNRRKSVFFQVDLDHGAGDFVRYNIPLPENFEEKDPLHMIHGNMFLARVKKYRGEDGSADKDKAFTILRNSILEPFKDKKIIPVKNVYDDQIVWARSPVRIDLAGGWTDTPPYSIIEGGKVVNISLELNGQPPLQVFIRPSKNEEIVLRSIDLGVREIITCYSDLESYSEVGSPFSIPKAALCLSGFHSDYNGGVYKDLKSQLESFGGGFEISFLAAIPKGSGMGTSSILAAAVLGALSDFCGFHWDHSGICSRTLALEQLLTTGGGWQDQYGGIVPGVKLLETSAGWDQTPLIKWLPDRLFSDPAYESSQLLYYTGVTRVAKNLLSEIVEGMFLNEKDRLSVLKDIGFHALETYNVIQQNDYYRYGKSILRTWELNKLLDAGTSNPMIESIISKIDDLAIGYKLPGAGGGGYLYIIAKDPDAAGRIKRILNGNPPNSRARFVDMRISNTGLEVSRS